MIYTLILPTWYKENIWDVLGELIVRPILITCQLLHTILPIAAHNLKGEDCPHLTRYIFLHFLCAAHRGGGGGGGGVNSHPSGSASELCQIKQIRELAKDTSEVTALLWKPSPVKWKAKQDKNICYIFTWYRAVK